MASVTSMLIAVTAPSAAQIVIYGEVFDSTAFADEALWISWTGSAPTDPAANVVGSNLDTAVEYRGGVGSHATLELRFINNRVYNGPGADLFFYEGSAFEPMEIAFAPNGPFIQLNPSDFINLGGPTPPPEQDFDPNLARIDLTEHGYALGEWIDVVWIRLTDYGNNPTHGGGGTRSADPLAVGARYVDPHAGLVAYFPFDGNYNNAVANAYHGLPQGGISTFELGVDGLAARFDGINDWLRVNHGGDLTFDLDTDSFSFSVWVKAETPQPGHQPIIFQDRLGSGGNGTTHNLVVRPDSATGNINFNSWYGPSSNTNFQSFTNAPVYLRGWVHIVGTFDADLGIKMLYVDGRLVDMEVRPSIPFEPNSFGAMTIGAGEYGSVTNFFRGLIDELRFYNVALSPQEVTALTRDKCPGDLTGSSDPNDSSYGVPNGIVDADDFFYYLDLFTLGCP